MKKVLLLLIFSLNSCGIAPVDSYDKHLIHFHQNGIELPNCEWCNAYSDEE